jgi:hypothetical protein
MMGHVQEQGIYRTRDLLEVAKGEGVQPFTLRMRRDWTEVGLLAEATLEPPRTFGAGVGRYWTERQVAVFRAVLRRYREGEPRRQLANVPVAVWLFGGDGYVPLGQVRRALRTYASTEVSRRQLESDALRHVLARPGLRAAAEKAAVLEHVIRRSVELLPAATEDLPEALADLQHPRLPERPSMPSGESAPPGVAPVIRIHGMSADDYRLRNKAALRGRNIYTGAPDWLYALARLRYQEEAFTYPLALQAEPGVLSSERTDELVAFACADLLIALGEVAAG